MAMGDGPMVPMFVVDPLWPKNLPDHWLMGATIGVDVDSSDTIWLVHRNTPDQFVARTEVGMTTDPPVAVCCQPGPPVLAFDQEGNLVHSWGGPGTETGDYVWPESNHGIMVDHMDNVWIGGNGTGRCARRQVHEGWPVLDAGRDARCPPDRRGGRQPGLHAR